MSLTHTTYFHPPMPNAQRFRTTTDREGAEITVDQNMHPKVVKAQRTANREKTTIHPSGWSHKSVDELRREKEEL